MKTFTDLTEYIQNNNFGISLHCRFNNQDVFLSNGIRYALDNNLMYLDIVYKSIELFCNNNFGIAYTIGETPIKNSEYGEYKTEIPADEEDSYLWIHRERNPLNHDEFCISCYFMFER